MNELEIKKLIRQQRAFFYKGRTLPVKTRIHMLKRLRCCILKYQEEIRSTLKHDLGKSRFESYMLSLIHIYHPETKGLILPGKVPEPPGRKPDPIPGM